MVENDKEEEASDLGRHKPGAGGQGAETQCHFSAQFSSI